MTTKHASVEIVSCRPFACAEGITLAATRSGIGCTSNPRMEHAIGARGGFVYLLRGQARSIGRHASRARSRTLR